MGVQKEILKRDPAFYGGAQATDSAGNQITIGGGTGTLALGVPGNIFDASPARIHTNVLAAAADCGTFVAGEGVIVNPREYALRGTTETDGSGNPIGYNTLAPSLTLSAGMVASFMTFGHVVVFLKNVKAILTAMDGSILVGAPAYKAGVSYAVGDIVSYVDSGTLKVYKCTTEVATSTNWTTDGSSFTEYTAGDDLCVLEVNGIKAA